MDLQAIYFKNQTCMQKRYKGLSNIGATCYMNSLLQTLFMTPEFRYGIYKWNYNQKIHPKQTDSIIFQLQKLFAKLQTDFPNQVTTKQLVKSFQWQDQEAQMQQDIQEFNRLLFEALEKSLTTKSQNILHHNFVQDYFQGQLIHYTKCYECNNQSARQQDFQDLIITVKNVYQKVYNDRLELGLQRYLKPEILDENNLYDCEMCGKKTRAERGARFVKMPSLLNVIFQRFTFNYFTMEREKINDRVEFPFILNFNDYIDGYDKIPNKLNQDSSQYFKNSYTKPINGKSSTPKLSGTGLGRTNMQKKTSTPSVAGKTKTKPSAFTKSFLADMRKKKLNNEDNEDLLFVNGMTVASETKVESNYLFKQQTLKVGSSSQQLNKQIKQNHQDNKQVKQNEYNHSKLDSKNQKSESIPSMVLPPPPPLFLVPSDLTVPYKMMQNKNNESIESQLQRKRLQSVKLQSQKEQQLIELESKNKQKIKTYLKQGPLVYQLYAVLVHNGTANQGHYYSYIKSYQDGKWYCFNDEKVTMINVLEIEKTFGNGNSNAYALYYRMVDQETGMGSTHPHLAKLKVELPFYIKQRLESQNIQIKQKEQNKIDNIQNLITLKICYQLYVKQIEVYKSNPLNLVVQKAQQLFNIGSEVKKENIRLRMFNPATETKLQTFGGRSHLSLEQLKIGSYKSLLLEIKGDDEEFDEYEMGTVSLRIALIEQNYSLNSLDESHLKLHKLTIKKNQTIQSIIQVIRQKRNHLSLQGDKNQQLCVIKRHQNNDQTIHQIISIKENLNKNTEDLSILDNEILFIQLEKQDLLWPMEFDNEIYRISIKYNSPATNQYITYLTDSRIKVGQLKNQLCMFSEVKPQDIIIRWGTKSGRELKDMDVTLKEARFITGTQLNLDFGIPAQPGQIRIQLFWVTDASPQLFNRLHEFQYLTDVPISGSLKASQVKDKFIPVVKKIKGIQLNPQEFRIRERVSEKIGKIYRERPMKEQQLIEKRQIAIQRVPDQNLDIKEFSIYFRIWDQLQWQLTKKIELVVTKNTTMKDLSELLSVDTNNKIVQQPTSMAICRILSIHKFNIIDLTQMEWFTINQDLSVIGEPMFVNSDGLLYIVKNANQEPRQLTKEEQQKFGGTVKPAIVRNKPRAYQPKEAKSMKIKVIQKEFQSEQKYQKMEDQEKQAKPQQRQYNEQKQS